MSGFFLRRDARPLPIGGLEQAQDRQREQYDAHGQAVGGQRPVLGQIDERLEERARGRAAGTFVAEQAGQRPAHRPRPGGGDQGGRREADQRGQPRPPAAAQQLRRAADDDGQEQDRDVEQAGAVGQRDAQDRQDGRRRRLCAPATPRDGAADAHGQGQGAGQGDDAQRVGPYRQRREQDIREIF